MLLPPKGLPERASILQSYTLITVLIACHQPFCDHVAPQRAEIIVKIGNDHVDFPLGIDAVFFERTRDFFENNTLFLALCRDGSEPAILKKGVEYALAVLFVAFGLQCRLIGFFA